MNLDLTGDLTLGAGKYACGGEVGNLSGPVYPLALWPKNAAPTAMSGLFEQTIDSPNAPVALPFDASLRATVTYVQAIDGAVFIVTYTFADATTTVLTQKGSSLIEHDPDNAVTGIAVQGTGKIRWLATGTIA